MLNTQIFFFFYSFAHKSFFLDKMIVYCAQIFPYIVILLAGIFLLFHNEIFQAEKPFRAFLQKWREIVLVFFSGIFAWIIAYVLKIIIHIPRPFMQFGNVHALLSESDFSFPSGHATFYMALAVALYLSHKKAGYLFILFAFIIGIARIMAGVHFPIDILCGFILGGGVAYLVKFLYLKFNK